MVIDTLAITKRMTAVGFTREHAEAQAGVFAEAFASAVVTKSDLAGAVRDLNHTIDIRTAELHMLARRGRLL